MTSIRSRWACALALLVLALLVLALPVLAVSTQFSEFTPLTTSATPIPIGDPDEATPITFSNPHFSQRTLADRVTQNTLVPNSNSGSWDMVTSNETGPNAGRYLFMPFETGTAGVQRVDTQEPITSDGPSRLWRPAHRALSPATRRGGHRGAVT